MQPNKRKGPQMRGRLERAVAPLTTRLLNHSLYRSVDTEGALRHFMRSHVFCVWDFMSLLTALKRSLTSCELPWIPSGDPEARRLINEIVLDEESDIDPTGAHLSHFEIYLDAMRDCGADRQPIEAFLDNLKRQRPLEEALSDRRLPEGVGGFVGKTLQVASSGKRHEVAAVFAIGREQVVPDMFRILVGTLADRAPRRWRKFRYYLNRHIEVDADRHRPEARSLLERLCGNSARHWREAERAARAALEARIALWDNILSGLPCGTTERGRQ